MTLLAGEATRRKPVIVVIDEFPYLSLRADDRRNVAGRLAASRAGTVAADPRRLGPLDDGSAKHIWPAALRAPARACRAAVRTRRNRGLLGLDPAAALDAQVVIGGMPRLAGLWEKDDDLWTFLARQLEDASSPLIVLGERSVNAELPADLKTRDVLAAIGAGERVYSAIQQRAGIKQSTLSNSLETLEEKRIVDKLTPYSARTRASKNTRYIVADPYLRFWLRFLAPNIDLVERGRGDVLLERMRQDWTTFRGRAIEPIIRNSIERLLPDGRLGDARFVGGYWTRDNRVEVDLVGGAEADHADPVAFVGSIKWRETEPFDRTDLARLIANRDEIPGAGDQTLLVGASRNGYDTSGLDVALDPTEIVGAWRP